MVICYAVLILAVFPTVFDNSYTQQEYPDQGKAFDEICFRILSEFFFPITGMPLGAQMTILLVIFLTIVIYHARLVEVTSRLDFIWKEQAEKELANMKSNRFLNDVLIKVFQITGSPITPESFHNFFFLSHSEYSSRSRSQLLSIRRSFRRTVRKDAQNVRRYVRIDTEFPGLLQWRHWEWEGLYSYTERNNLRFRFVDGGAAIL